MLDQDCLLRESSSHTVCAGQSDIDHNCAPTLPSHCLQFWKPLRDGVIEIGEELPQAEHFGLTEADCQPFDQLAAAIIICAKGMLYGNNNRLKASRATASVLGSQYTRVPIADASRRCWHQHMYMCCAAPVPCLGRPCLVYTSMHNHARHGIHVSTPLHTETVCSVCCRLKFSRSVLQLKRVLERRGGCWENGISNVRCAFSSG